MPAAAWAVFVDFDGTISDLDTFDVLVEHFAGRAAWDATQRGLDDGTMSLRDVLALQASYVRAPYDDVSAFLRGRVRLDPAFAGFAKWCAERAIPLTVVSSGIERIIRDRLVDLDLGTLPVVANGIEADPAGWRIVFRDPVPNGTDKAAVVRAAASAGTRTAFVGDGRSDYAAALAADVRFARRDFPLAAHLRQRGIAFTPFDSFADVAAAFATLTV